MSIKIIHIKYSILPNLLIEEFRKKAIVAGEIHTFFWPFEWEWVQQSASLNLVRVYTQQDSPA